MTLTTLIKESNYYGGLITVRSFSPLLSGQEVGRMQADVVLELRVLTYILIKDNRK